MKLIALALVAVLLVQEDPKWCDVSKTQSRDYCAACAYWPSSDQMEKGLCKKCRSRIEKVETCVKVYWDCPKAHDRPKWHSKNCGSVAGCCKEMPSLSLITYECETCHRLSKKQADVKHATEACEGKIKRNCTRSGKFPHGGTEE